MVRGVNYSRHVDLTLGEDICRNRHHRQVPIREGAASCCGAEGFGGNHASHVLRRKDSLHSSWKWRAGGLEQLLDGNDSTHNLVE